MDRSRNCHAMKKNTLFVVFAIFFIIPAIYHLVAVFYQLNTSPIWRNLLFVGINLFGAYGVLKRPAYFLYFFAALLLQQFYSHGSDLIDMWDLQHKIDWISLSVLVVMPVIFVFLILDKLGKLK